MPVRDIIIEILGQHPLAMTRQDLIAAVKNAEPGATDSAINNALYTLKRDTTILNPSTGFWKLNDRNPEDLDIIQGTGADIDQPDDVDDSQTFVLEKYLEDFIVANFGTIFTNEMEIYNGGGSNGKQFATDIGPIDILAWKPIENTFVVIELKKGRSSDKVVGQVLRYMGWIKKHLCHDKQTVKGLVICGESDAKLSYALEMTKDIAVKYYSVSFKLTETPSS